MRSFRPSAKVLVTGAFCTGKTTLVRALADRLREDGVTVDLVGDVGRACPLPLNREQSVGVSAWLVGEQIRAESEASLGNAGVVLCDRGIPDILSHTAGHPAATAADRLYGETVDGIGGAWARTYDLVIWSRIDPSHSIQEDGLRVVDEEYRRELELSLERVLGALGIHALIAPGDGAERLRFAVQAVRHLLSSRPALDHPDRLPESSR